MLIIIILSIAWALSFVWNLHFEWKSFSPKRIEKIEAYMQLDIPDDVEMTVFRKSTGLGDGEVSGYIHGELYRTLYFETMCNLLGLAVSRKCRRMGLGRKLVQTCEEWAKQNGVHLMRVNSGMGRTGAHDFYRDMGYTDEKEQKRFLKRL